MRRIRHQLANEAGAEIAEAALVLPIAFMFLIGIVWFGRAFNVYSTITQAAQQGAVAAARPSCVTCGNAILSDAAVDNVIYGVLRSSNLDPAQITSSGAPTPLPCLAPAPPGGCTTKNNITINRGKEVRDLSTSCTAVTYKFVEPPPEKPAPPRPAAVNPEAKPDPGKDVAKPKPKSRKLDF